jgi:hypothetical protein
MSTFIIQFSNGSAFFHLNLWSRLVKSLGTNLCFQRDSSLTLEAIDILQDGAPQLCLWVYKPHENCSYMMLYDIICTMNHGIQQLFKATERYPTGAPSCIKTTCILLPKMCMPSIGHRPKFTAWTRQGRWWLAAQPLIPGFIPKEWPVMAKFFQTRTRDLKQNKWWFLK